METRIVRLPEQKSWQINEHHHRFAQEIFRVLASWTTPIYLKWHKLYIPMQWDLLNWFVVWKNFLPVPVCDYWNAVCATMEKQFQLQVAWTTIQEQIICVLAFLWCVRENKADNVLIKDGVENWNSAHDIQEEQFASIDYLITDIFPKLFSNHIQIAYVRSKNNLTISNKLAWKNEKVDFFKKWVEKNDFLQQFLKIVCHRFNKSIKPEFTCQSLIYCLLYLRNVLKIEVEVIWFEKYFSLKMTSLYNNSMQSIEWIDLPYQEQKIKSKNKPLNVYRSLPAGQHEADEFARIVKQYWVSDKLSAQIVQLLWLDTDAIVGDAIHAYFSLEDSKYYELLHWKQTRIAFRCIRKLFEQYDVQHGVSRKRWVLWRK